VFLAKNKLKELHSVALIKILELTQTAFTDHKLIQGFKEIQRQLKHTLKKKKKTSQRPCTSCSDMDSEQMEMDSEHDAMDTSHHGFNQIPTNEKIKTRQPVLEIL